MILKVSKQINSGLITEFVNIDSGKHISLDHTIRQIEKGKRELIQSRLFTQRLIHTSDLGNKIM